MQPRTPEVLRPSGVADELLLDLGLRLARDHRADPQRRRRRAVTVAEFQGDDGDLAGAQRSLAAVLAVPGRAG